jgi:high-affinity iron transporter
VKLKFNFISALVASLALSLPGCGGRPTRPAAQAPDGGDAQRVAALLEYVAGDYSRAVQAGVVVAPAEYDEQLRFSGEARAMATALLSPAAPQDGPVLARVAEVSRLVQSKADPKAVAAACHAARDLVVARFKVPTRPPSRPSLARAQALYTRACATCHGADGDARTERARSLDPAPANFRDPRRLRELSPYRAFNALTFGVAGTSMASFAALSAEQRWDLAFYVLRLGHVGSAAALAPEPQVSLPLAELAARSDRELAQRLAEGGVSNPQGALFYARVEAPFRPAPAGSDVERARALLARATQALDAGRPQEADRLVLDAYLEGFEAAEPRLRAKNPGETAAVEADFQELRTAIARGGPATAKARELRARIERLASGETRPLLPFAAALLIYVREGIEAALLVGALLAGAARLGRPDAGRLVHAGWLSALPAGVLTWWLSSRLIALGGAQRELVEALVGLLAAGVLFSVSFWMISKAESRRWTAYLKRGLEEGLSRRNVGVLFGLAFLAVYREAAETVLFTQALLLESGSDGGQVLAGAAVGLALVALLALLLKSAVRRLPLGPFFAVSSLLLCGLAISFAGSGVHELVAAGLLRPRPVSFPEIPWLGVHPELNGLALQLAIAAVIAAAGVATLRRSITPRTAVVKQEVRWPR